MENNNLEIVPPVSVSSSQDDNSQLTKQSCHDSGIDIRDPNTILQPVPPVAAKKNYSDADIVLSTEWVPPLTIAPTMYTESPPSILSAQAQVQAQNIDAGGRKKTSSVSFSVDDNGEQPQSGIGGDNKKNKMLKRLSYPITWVEGLTGEGKPSDAESAPNTGDSSQSVFSKVFSR